ncbi:hypothetical protein QEH56_03475 [Pelagicoccus enzymogenes]|uniref:hypothetical protein n=1 Tax=Pelagicoccus enzymogenes TaxID=2773457 RepID=UPI00280D242A|nr:hypothetical protein [Pelagicoccus enzymogenes]MDQ8197189.1 hypothetical protein [Pelagicoccus enzymogenes]
MISVLTGDIVGSRELSSEKRTDLDGKLKGAALRSGLGDSLEVFRGDSWQCLCSPHHSAIERALHFRAFLLGKYEIDTRISIGIGAVESLHREKVSLSQGEAFELSGLGLSSLPDHRRLEISLSETLEPSSLPFLNAACALLDGITSEWTARQSLAVALALTDDNQYELANRFDPPISAQAFGKHLAKAQWKLLKHALESIQRGLSLILPPESEK